MSNGASKKGQKFGHPESTRSRRIVLFSVSGPDARMSILEFPADTYIAICILTTISLPVSYTGYIVTNVRSRLRPTLSAKGIVHKASQLRTMAR